MAEATNSKLRRVKNSLLNYDESSGFSLHASAGFEQTLLFFAVELTNDINQLTLICL